MLLVKNTCSRRLRTTEFTWDGIEVLLIVLAPGLVDDTTKAGQEIEYAMLTQAGKDNPNIFTDAEARAFRFNNPQLAFELDQQGNVQATEEQLANLQTRFDRLKSNADYIKELVNGSKYDRAVRQDTREDRQSDLFTDMLAGMTTLNPNDIFSIEQIEEEINAGRLLYGEDPSGVRSTRGLPYGVRKTLGRESGSGSADSAWCKTSATLSLLGLRHLHWRVSAFPNRRALHARSLSSLSLMDTTCHKRLVVFPVNSTGSTELQFSPQTGVEGNIDTVFFTEDDGGKLKIGVAPQQCHWFWCRNSWFANCSSGRADYL